MKNILNLERAYDIVIKKDEITFKAIEMIEKEYKKDGRRYALIGRDHIESEVALSEGQSQTLEINVDFSKGETKIIKAEDGYIPCKGEHVGACYGAGPVDCYHLEEESKCYRKKDVHYKDDRVVYNMTGILGRVVADSQESYIYFDTGEKYSLSLEEAVKCIDKIGVNVKIQVNIYYSGKIEVKYLGEHLNECKEATLDAREGEIKEISI